MGINPTEMGISQSHDTLFYQAVIILNTYILYMRLFIEQIKTTDAKKSILRDF